MKNPLTEEQREMLDRLHQYIKIHTPGKKSDGMGGILTTEDKISLAEIIHRHTRLYFASDCERARLKLRERQDIGELLRIIGLFRHTVETLEKKIKDIDPEREP